ncbi:hypothetical protein MMC07_002664 [Pseudocyphellaria aurata]|nr:hypothetical protein [Pseudocyphellaria aurata]
MYFTAFTPVTLAVVLSFANLIFAGDRLNCKGGAGCYFVDSKLTPAQILTVYIDHIDPNRIYLDGEKIACYRFNLLGFHSHICAFLQKTNGAPGATIRDVSAWITGHGCRVCGSVPIGYPDDDNVDNGMLTYNIVSSGACRTGLCPPQSVKSESVERR